MGEWERDVERELETEREASRLRGAAAMRWWLALSPGKEEDMERGTD